MRTEGDKGPGHPRVAAARRGLGRRSGGARQGSRSVCRSQVRRSRGAAPNPIDPATGAIKDSDNLADARMYLGAVLVAQGRPTDADAQFEQLLLDKPDYQPDPLRVALPAIDAFIDTRTRVREKLAAMQAESVRRRRKSGRGSRPSASCRLGIWRWWKSSRGRRLSFAPIRDGSPCCHSASVSFRTGRRAGDGCFWPANRCWRWEAWSGPSCPCTTRRSATTRPCEMTERQGRIPSALRSQRSPGTCSLPGSTQWRWLEFCRPKSLCSERVRIRKREPQELTWRPVLAPGGIGVVGSF